MVRLIARSSLATAVAAAMAVPLVISASAAGTPSVPAPSVPSGQSVQQTLNQLVPVPLAPAAPTSPSTSSSPNNDSSSSASANALSIPALNTCIGCSDGQSSSTPNGDGTTTNSSSADATGIKVLGINLAGGSASTGQSNSGDVLAIPIPGLLNLAVGDWIATATGTPTSCSRGSALDLDLNNDCSGSPNHSSALTQLITLAVLEGKTTTTASCEAGGATGETNGANLNLGQGALVVLLLHTDASTNNGSHVYLASINGNQIANSQQVGGNPITITIPGLTTVTLLANPSTGCSSGNNPGGNNPPGVCPPGIVSIQLPPGTCLGSGLTATQTSTSSAGKNAGVQAASTGGVSTPTTGVGLGILGFLLLGGGLLALGASRVARRWRKLT